MPLPAHLFASEDGHLYDTRAADWYARRAVRRDYKRTPGDITRLSEVKAALRAGPFTFPGCYPLFFTTRDGAALSFEAVRAQFRQVAWDFMQDASTGWRVDGVGVNHEDSDLYCAHTGARIPSAYCEDDGQPDEAQEWADFDPDC